MQGIFVYYFYILQLYSIHWLALIIFWWYLYGFLCRGSCHLQTGRVTSSFQSGFLLFLSLLWLLWLGLRKLCWIVMVRVGTSTLVLFLVLEEMFSGFQYWGNVCCGFVIYMAFYHVATPVFILAWRVWWTEEPGGLHSPWGCEESYVTEQLKHFVFPSTLEIFSF